MISFRFAPAFLLTAAIAVAQCTISPTASGGFACSSAPLTFAALSVPVTKDMVADYHAPVNSTSPANSAIVSALNSGPNTFVFPTGDYRIDNSAGPLVIANFSGKLQFNPGARLVCTNANNMCVQFTFGSPKIDGINIAYTSPATYRTDNAVGLFFYQGSDQQLTHATVTGSGGPAIQFQESVRPSASNITISNGMADGLDFFNCQNAVVTNLQTETTGDDGLAFVNYSRYQDYNGGTANNIRVNNSNARGITINGASNVTVSGFSISNTTNAGVMCNTDTYYATRTGNNNLFTSGIVVSPGTYRPSWSSRPNGINGLPFGIEWSMPANQGSCTFQNIVVSGVTGNSQFGASNVP